ncbi:hypothetical protein ACSAZK_06825 [Methanosarcina sp. Mfa9]
MDFTALVCKPRNPDCSRCCLMNLCQLRNKSN